MIYVTPENLPINIYMGTRTVINEEEDKETIYPIFGEVGENEIFLYFIDVDGGKVEIGEIEYEAIRAARAILLENRLEHERMAAVATKTEDNKN